MPTETVYGLAADATADAAVAAIYRAKGRPSFNPLIVHVAGLADAERLGDFPQAARALARRFWPGPLTLVVPLRAGSGIAAAVTAGLGTIALRCPAHPAMQALLAACAQPLAAPSANASGRISPTAAAHVRASLAGRIPLIVDAGPTARGSNRPSSASPATASACSAPARSRSPKSSPSPGFPKPPPRARSRRPASSPATMRRPSRSASPLAGPRATNG
jgi:tRNA threonylcarbamoyl adenosine modification protein (Sua5/YciO/YrdC/YwlC family)